MNAIKNRIPQEHRIGWMLIARNLVSGANEREAEGAAGWISQHGEAAGFRIPNTRERARAIGMGAYLAALGLSEQEMYDAQGNSFDPHAIVMRLRDGIRQWAAGGPVGRHQYPSMDAVAGAFEDVKRYVSDRGLGGCTRPFPHDLFDGLIAAAGTPAFSATPAAPITTAEDGRRS